MHIPYMLAVIDFLVPGVVIAVVIAIAVLGRVVASRYKTIPPNTIGVFYGRKYTVIDAAGVKHQRGFITMTGGGRILLPIVERFQEMSIAAFQVDITEKGVPTKKNVPVEIHACATCRISQLPDEQSNAVQAFLGKDQQEINETISQILRGHMRSIIANLDVDQILRDRAEFNKKVLEEAGQEFQRLGVQIITLVVQDVRDEQGYIQALGKQEITSKLRDAAVQTAQNERDTAVAQSNAKREASMVAAENAVKVADAEKQRDINIAEFKTQTETKRAQAEMANAIAKTSQEQNLMVLQAQRDSAAADAGILTQQKRGLQKEAELKATVITTAEAEAKAVVIRAEAQQNVASKEAQRAAIEAEGKKNANIAEGFGIASKTLAIAEAEGKATQIKLTAEAEGAKANLLAAAAGNEAALLAVAAGKQATLLAEAEGTLKLAEAMKALTDTGRLLLVLDRLPLLLDKGGDAGAKMLGSVFTPLGESMKAIKSVSIVDMGGSEGKGGVAKFAGSIPGMIAEMLTKAEAQGIDIKPLLKLLRIDPSKLQSMMGLVEAALPEKEPGDGVTDVVTTEPAAPKTPRK